MNKRIPRRGWPLLAGVLVLAVLVVAGVLLVPVFRVLLLLLAVDAGRRLPLRG